LGRELLVAVIARQALRALERLLRLHGVVIEPHDDFGSGDPSSPAGTLPYDQASGDIVAEARSASPAAELFEVEEGNQQRHHAAEPPRTRAVGRRDPLGPEPKARAPGTRGPGARIPWRPRAERRERRRLALPRTRAFP